MLNRSECPRPPGLIECSTVVDIGPGIKPMGWYESKRHICVEPCWQYALRLRSAGFETVEKTAIDYLQPMPRAITRDMAIYMLDSLEHMEQTEGERVLQAAVALRPKQIVVFTPHGYLPQHGDAWNLGGEYWQEHRSGWLPEQFLGWETTVLELPHLSFLAVWTRED